MKGLQNSNKDKHDFPNKVWKLLPKTIRNAIYYRLPFKIYLYGQIYLVLLKILGILKNYMICNFCRTVKQIARFLEVLYSTAIL